MVYPHPAHNECKYCEAPVPSDEWICDDCFKKKQTIKVVETDAPVDEAGADSRFMATFGDYDLDCKTGLGDSEEAATDDLMYNSATERKAV